MNKFDDTWNKAACDFIQSVRNRLAFENKNLEALSTLVGNRCISRDLVRAVLDDLLTKLELFADEGIGRYDRELEFERKMRRTPEEFFQEEGGMSEAVPADTFLRPKPPAPA